MSSLMMPLTLWVAIVAAVVTIDLTGYLVAAARAQQLADAAALAAVSTDVRGAHAAAGEVAEAGGGSLDACDCGRTGRAEVVVGVAVEGLIVPRVGAGRVRATAQARRA
jgi:Flp pilus assembly protein TadG